MGTLLGGDVTIDASDLSIRVIIESIIDNHLVIEAGPKGSRLKFK